MFDAKGFQQNRDYFSQAPFENIDPLNGGLVLTFTDLVLPGNAGFDLRFQRSFNSRDSTWRFGLAGFVMQITDTPSEPHTPIDCPDCWLPKLVTSDGTEHQTVWKNFSYTPEGIRWVFTAQFWTYDRLNRRLYLPDGTVCYYDATGRLVEVIDRFSAGFTLTWTASTLHIAQFLSVDQARGIDIGLTGGGWAFLDDNGRRWTFVWDGPRLQQVAPPAGGTWQYGYGAGGVLTQVTTPWGGTTAYTYTSHTFTRGQDPPPAPQLGPSLVVATKTVGGRAVSPGTWIFDYTNAPPGDPCACTEWTTITTPSGAQVVYQHAWSNLLQTSPPLDPNLVLKMRIVRASAQAPAIETETREYVMVPVGGSSAGGTKEVSSRTIVRDGATYATSYSYATSNFGDYHRPFQTTETGPGLSRTTTRTFDYAFPPVGDSQVLGKIAAEQVTVNGQSFTKGWGYDHNTGFVSSQTEYGIPTTFVPDGVGNVYRATDANNHTTTFGYQWGVVSGIWKPETVVFRQINPEGTVASETRGSRTTRFDYDDIFRIRQTAPPGSNAITTAYDEGAGTVIVRRGSSQTVTTLDGFGRPTHTANAVGIQTRTDYDAEGRKIYDGYPFAGTDNNVGTHADYDPLGRVRRKTNPDQDHSYVELTYGAGTVAIRDELGRITTQTWNAFGDPDDRRLASVRDAKNSLWSYGYNALGKLTSVTAPDGIVRSWQYDARNLLVQETQPESGGTICGYDAVGNLTSKTDANGTPSIFTYDGNDRLNHVTAGGRHTTITYEPGADNRQTASGYAVASTFVYDAAGRPRHRSDIIDGLRIATEFAYDGNDNLTDITYTSGRHVRQEYDAENRLTLVRDESSATTYAQSFAYHPSGALSAYTSGNGLVHNTGYDPNRYWVSTIDAGELHLSYNNYDAVGNVGTIGDPRTNMSQSFSYDELDRLTVANGPFGQQVFAYDAHGNRTTVPGTTYAYEPGKLRLSDQNTSHFTYFNNGNLRTAPNVTYTYTPENLLETASGGGLSASYGYDADTWRTKKVNGGTTSYYSRGARGELLDELTMPATGAPTFKDYVYAGGRLIAEAVRSTPVGNMPPLPSLPGMPYVPGVPGPVTSPGLVGPGVTGFCQDPTALNFGGPLPCTYNPGTPSGPSAVFYEDVGYGGAILTTATADVSGGSWNDRISAVRVLDNTIVILYENANYQGAQLVLTHDVPDLRLYPGPGSSGSWNDAVSSIRILPGGSPVPTAHGSDLLGPGEFLLADGLRSNGSYQLQYQGDENLVLSDSGVPVWDTQTNVDPGHPGKVEMQGDGNVVMTNSSGAFRWTSRTNPHSGAFLLVQSDGNLVVYDADGRAIRSIRDELVDAQMPLNKLLPGHALLPDHARWTPDGEYALIFQTDGNLVLYHRDGVAVWDTGTGGHDNTDGWQAVMRETGFFAIEDASGNAVWQPGPNISHPEVPDNGAHLELGGANGLLAVINPNGYVQWRVAYE